MRLGRGTIVLVRIALVRIALVTGALVTGALVTVGCATTGPPAAPQATPIQPAPGLELPAFELHTFDNGLRVVTVENHAHPIVGMTAYVTTGGRTEIPHYAGALHFIEHLVFKGGTRRFPPTAFRKRIAALGDESGGWTWDDEIQFGFQVPRKNFAEALDVFAESLLDLQWSERWFEDERKVVLQEIEKVAERPWQRLWDAWDLLAFKRHPYRRPVIGDAETVRAQTMEELQRYYEQRFTPNHLILIVVGDFETPKMVKALRRKFGKYQAGPASFELPNVAEAEQRSPRSKTLLEPAIKNGRFLIGFRTPGAAHEDTPGLMVLAELLQSSTEGLPAWLTRKTQWVTSIDVEYSYMVDYGHLIVSGECDPKHLKAVAAWIERHLTTIAERPFSKAATQEAARALLTSRARSWETFGEQAQGLGFMIERMGPRAARRVTEQILNQTPERLAAVARKYLRPERLVTTTQRPPKARTNAPANIGERALDEPLPNLLVPGLLKPTALRIGYRRTGDNGEVIRYQYDNGLTLLVRPTRANSLAFVVAHVAGGQWIEPAAKAGLAVLTNRTLLSGTQHLSVAQWDRVLSLEALSAQSELRFSERAAVPRNVHARDGSTLSLGGTVDQIELLIALMGEALFRATFPAEGVAKARRILLSEIESLPEDNLELIKQEFYRLAFPNHPYGRPTIGTARTVKLLTRDDVQRFHQRAYRPGRITVAVSGRVDPDRVAELISTRWGDSPTEKAQPLPGPTPLSTREEPDRKRVLIRGKEQWCVNIGGPTLNAADERFPAAEVLFAVARGRHFYKYVYELGTSYRSWIKLWAHRAPALWILENDVAKDGFDDTVMKMRNDLRLYGHGVFTQQDVDLARTRLLNRSVLDRQNGQRMAFELARTGALELPFDYHERRRAALRALTKDQVNDLAREIFGADVRYELITR